MKSRWLYFFGAGCTLCLAGCLSSTARQPIEQPPQPPETKPEQIIKTVAVTEDGFPRLFLRRRDVRDSVALAEQGLAVSESEFEAGYQRGALPDKISEEDYRRRLREDLLLLAYLRDSDLIKNEEFESRARALLRSQLAALVLDEVVNRQVSVTDAEVRAHYDQSIAEYSQPQRVGVRLILVATQAEADDVMRRLAAGGDFGTIAGEVSLHTSRTQGGKMEPFSRGTLSPTIEDLAFRLRPGEIGSVANSRGVWILQKVADSPASVTPFEQVKEEIRAKLLEEKTERARQEFLTQLQNQTYGN